MSHDWYESGPHPSGLDLESRFYYGGRNNPFDDNFAVAGGGNPEAAAYWATLSLKQKIVGSICSIAVGAGAAGLLIALASFLH